MRAALARLAADGLIDIGGTLTYPGGVIKSVNAQARKQADGSVLIPEALRPYMGAEKIEARKL